MSVINKVNFDLSLLTNKVNNVIENEINNLLKDFTTKYSIYEESHNGIIDFAKNVLKQTETYSDIVKNNITDNSNILEKKETKCKCDFNVKEIVSSIKEMIGEELKPIYNDLHNVKQIFKLQEQNITECRNDFLLVSQKMPNYVELLKTISDLKSEIDFLKNDYKKELSLMNSEIHNLTKSNLQVENITLKIIDKQEEVVENIEIVKEVEEEEDDEEEVEEDEEDEQEKQQENVIVEHSKKQDEEEEKEEDEEEYFEIEIDDFTYYTNNEENGFIYETTSNEELGQKVGYLKEGDPYFY